jgi:hypothetical protein
MRRLAVLVLLSVVLAVPLTCAAMRGRDWITLSDRRQKEEELLWRMSTRTLRECDETFGADAPDAELPQGWQDCRRTARQNLAELARLHPDWVGKD